MPCAEPWGYDSVIHEREQTYHSTGMGLELGSFGAKAVSFLLSRPAANLISGVVQLPKLAPEVPVPVPELRREVPLFGVPVPPTGFPVSSMIVTALKSVLKPKNWLNAAGNF